MRKAPSLYLQMQQQMVHGRFVAFLQRKAIEEGFPIVDAAITRSNSIALDSAIGQLLWSEFTRTEESLERRRLLNTLSVAELCESESESETETESESECEVAVSYLNYQDYQSEESAVYSETYCDDYYSSDEEQELEEGMEWEDHLMFDEELAGPPELEPLDEYGCYHADAYTRIEGKGKLRRFH